MNSIVVSGASAGATMGTAVGTAVSMADSATNPSASRVFGYEVSGLRQNTDKDNNNYPFRSRRNVSIKVPYSRMNEEMRRITRMGGTIVNIKPLTFEECPTT